MSAARTPRTAHRLGLAVAGCGLILAAAGLCACGAEGSLSRPGPYFGSAAKEQYAVDKANGRTSGDPAIDAAARRPLGSNLATKPADQDNAPRTTRDIQDPAQKLTPLSTSPVEGLPNPLGSPVSTRPPG